MNLYGNDRLTKDVNVIADNLLPVAKNQIAGWLKQGGERYNTKTEEKIVIVNWIIRNDEFKPFLNAALKEAVNIYGFPILTPKWLVILKFIAGRFKDQEDAVFLLSRNNLINRSLIKEHIIKHGGAIA